MTSWNGTWRNQYGSIVVIENDNGGIIRGVFRTALEDSSFFGREVPIHGAAHGDVIGFTAAGNGTAGPAAVSYTGLPRQAPTFLILAGAADPLAERSGSHHRESRRRAAATTSSGASRGTKWPTPSSTRRS
jgi:hypothetical protein